MMTMKQILYASGAALTMFGTTAASSIVVNADTTPTTVNGKANEQKNNKGVYGQNNNSKNNQENDTDEPISN
ncbi:hypothetical protein [Lentilactobacillus hilgardii]|uniref:hypothetical protein n=1 Tax=Lentilactobacillus hilgardii TaxID=1588 RepID=UPI00390C466F